jgi:hypothetical protein
MTRTAIVYHEHHGPTREYARLLADLLYAKGHTPELFPVKEASAHEVVYCEALILLSPATFGRLHGTALARAIAGVRPVAVAVVGDEHDAERVRGLFTAEEGEERPHVTFFAMPDAATDRSSVASVGAWVSALPERPPRARLQGGPTA